MNEERAGEFLSSLIPIVAAYGLRVIGAILILVVGWIAAGLLAKIVDRALVQAKTDETLRSFFTPLVKIGVLVFAVLAALSKFGIQTASFVAVLGAVGFAIGFALQGSLGNFAAGVMILIFRPIRVGDFVQAGGTVGAVDSIGIFVTTLHTPDNKKVLVPNAKITSDVITNYNANGTRRVDMIAGIGYGDSIHKAQGVLEKILEDHPKILREPAPKVAVTELGDSSVNFVVRPWVKAEDYWTVHFDVTRRIKEEFDASGVSIPFPQRDVHLFQESAAS